MLVTTVPRAKAKKMLSSCLCFNLMQMMALPDMMEFIIEEEAGLLPNERFGNAPTPYSL